MNLRSSLRLLFISKAHASYAEAAALWAEWHKIGFMPESIQQIIDYRKRVGDMWLAFAGMVK